MRFSDFCKVFWLFIFGSIGNVHRLSGQSLDKVVRQAVNTSRITLSRGDSIESFVVVNQHKSKSLKSDRFYTWYTANAVRHTQGGTAGKLLHGMYVLSNHKKDLIAKGQFRYGLRVGQWQHWHVNGQTKSVEQWKKGKRHGSYRGYDIQGNPLEKGNYRYGQLHGKRVVWEAGNLVRTEMYRRGRLLNDRQKKGKKNVHDSSGGEPSIDSKTKSQNNGRAKETLRKKLRFREKERPEETTNNISEETLRTKEAKQETDGGKSTRKKKKLQKSAAE
jgi:hypothetical protein